MKRLYFDAMDAALASWEAAGRLRRLHVLAPQGHGRVERDGAVLINFASNDYLGLAGHPELKRRSALFAERFGVGSGASRLVCGTFEIHASLEVRLAALKGTEDALLLASGFQANQSVLSALLDRALGGASPLVYSDRLNHASMHEGILTAGIRQRRYRHNDLDHLESLLRRDEAQKGSRFIVTESVFSMDGDRADLPGLCALAERFGCFLYVDEAHATGVLGPNGAGLTTDPAVKGRIDLVMGTFGKALGGFGAFAACSARVKSWLTNRCRGLIYSTALPPPILGAAEAALDLVPGMEAERERLHVYADRVRDAADGKGHATAASSTQIVPLVLGQDRDVLAAAERLEKAGFLVAAIRPPTVPAGSARLRLTLSAAHAEEQVDGLIAALRAL